MNDLYNTFAKNLVKLRKERKLTQLELANELNFSDRNISKWENGQSLPTTEVMVELSHFFNVSIDYLLSEHVDGESVEHVIDERKHMKDHLIILGLSILCVYLIATIAFVFTPQFWGYSWLSFVYAVPVSLIVSIVFIGIWFKKYPYLFIAVSLLVWGILASVYLSFLVMSPVNLWFLFFIGIPLQIAVILWSRMGHYHRK